MSICNEISNCPRLQLLSLLMLNNEAGGPSYEWEMVQITDENKEIN